MTIAQLRALALPIVEPSKAGRVAVWATLAVLFVLFALAGTNALGEAALWENAHWTLSSLLAAAIALSAARGSANSVRRIRIVAAIGLWTYAAGALAWDIQIGAGAFLVPAPSDILFLASTLPMAAALLLRAGDVLSHAELAAVALDGLIVLLAVATGVLYVFAPVAQGASPGLGAILLAYPVGFLGLAGFTALTALATNERRAGGLFGVALGLAAIGVVWAVWIAEAVVEVPPAGSALNMVSSVAVVLVGYGIATWRPEMGNLSTPGRISLAALPIVAILAAAAFIGLAAPDGQRAGSDLVRITAWSLIGLAAVRQTLLLLERSRFLARERLAAERERALRDAVERGLEAQTASERRYREVVAVFVTLGEKLTFTADESQILTAAAAAVDELIPGTDGQVDFVEPSTDRLMTAFRWGPAGGGKTATEPPSVDVHNPTSCPGTRRGSAHLVDDVTAAFAIACPTFPRVGGAVLCLPLVGNGQSLGVIHLARPHFDRDDTAQAGRVAEQVALAIANARLVQSMRDLALTDPLTGLYNGRFFDPYLERELAHDERDGPGVGVVMIDLDAFKSFNDTFGHPGGDEALRVFARTALGAIRESDTLARYGGEEFILLVRDADLTATAAVAEKLRAAVEAAVVDLDRGRHGTITASFGVANSLVHGTDRQRLVRTADRALYQAKKAGRNRVVVGEAGQSRRRP